MEAGACFVSGPDRSNAATRSMVWGSVICTGQLLSMQLIHSARFAVSVSSSIALMTGPPTLPRDCR